MHRDWILTSTALYLFFKFFLKSRMVALEHLDFTPMLASIVEWRDVGESVGSVNEKSESSLVRMWKKLF